MIAVSTYSLVLTSLLLVKTALLQRYHSELNLVCCIFVAVLILYEIDEIQKETGNEKKKKTQSKTNYSHVNVPIKAIDHVDLDSIILIS